MKSWLRYWFVRRLAVKPAAMNEPWPQIRRYEWQRLPHGYRWF